MLACAADGWGLSRSDNEEFKGLDLVHRKVNASSNIAQHYKKSAHADPPRASAPCTHKIRTPRGTKPSFATAKRQSAIRRLPWPWGIRRRGRRRS